MINVSINVFDVYLCIFKLKILIKSVFSLINFITLVIAKIKTSPSDENIHHLYEGKTSAVHHNKNGAIIVSKEKRSVKKNKKIPRSTKNNNKAPVDRHDSDTMIARFERKCSKSHEQNQVIIEDLAKSKDRTSVNDTNVSVNDTPDSVSINNTYVLIDDTKVPINDTSDSVSINGTLMSVNDTPVSPMDLPVSYIDDVMETVEVLAITSTGDNITTGNNLTVLMCYKL